MTRFARMNGDTVVEIIDTDSPLSALFHADLAASFEAVDDQVTAGMTRDGNGGFAQPAGLGLPAMQAVLTARIDAAAEVARARHATPGAGQAMVYLEKARQAAAYLVDGDPDEDDYPMLVAEVGITGDTVDAVAAMVDASHRQWIDVVRAIEVTRLSAKRAIAAADDAAAAHAIYGAVEWPVGG